jgi:hypothetical protein
MQPDDLASAIGVDCHSDYRGDRDDAAALARFRGGGVEPQRRPFAGERPVEEGVHALVDLPAQLGDLRFAHPDSPIACTKSTRRVDTLPIQASWITAISAFSERLRASRNGAK